MPIELGIATPAVPRTLARSTTASASGPPTWASPCSAPTSARRPKTYCRSPTRSASGWPAGACKIVQATGYNPVLVGEDAARRAADLDRLTRRLRGREAARQPDGALTGCGSYHPTHRYGPHPQNHSPRGPPADRRLPTAGRSSRRGSRRRPGARMPHDHRPGHAGPHRRDRRRRRLAQPQSQLRSRQPARQHRRGLRLRRSDGSDARPCSATATTGRPTPRTS